MTGLDAVLALGLGLGVWRGLRTGAMRQVVSTAGWVGGFVLATALMAPVGQVVAASLGVSTRTAPVLGFVVLFGGVVAGLALAGHALRTALEAVRLGGLDRAAGALVGGLRAAFGLSVALVATAVSPLPGGGPLVVSAEARRASVLYDPVASVAPEVWGVVRAATPGLQAALVDKFNTWQQGRPEAVTGEAELR